MGRDRLCAARRVFPALVKTRQEDLTYPRSSCSVLSGDIGEAEGEYPSKSAALTEAGVAVTASDALAGFFREKMPATEGSGMSGKGSLKGRGISFKLLILDSSWIDLLCCISCLFLSTSGSSILLRTTHGLVSVDGKLLEGRSPGCDDFFASSASALEKSGAAGKT